MAHQLHSVREAAQQLGVCKNTVHKLVSEQALKSVLIGRCRRITADSIKQIATDGYAPPRRDN